LHLAFKASEFLRYLVVSLDEKQRWPQDDEADTHRNGITGGLLSCTPAV